MTAGEDRPTRLTVLIATVGDHRLGLPIGSVRELLPLVRVTPLPGAPPVVEGVIDVRTELVPVLDLHVRLGLEPRPARLGDHLVLADAGHRLVALHVDHASDLVELAHLAVEEARELAGAGSVAGVARLDDGLLVVHDLDRFLWAEEAVELDRALAGVGTPPGAGP